MNFGFIFIYFHFLKAFCYVESLSCLLPYLSNLYYKCPFSKRPLFKVSRVAASKRWGCSLIVHSSSLPSVNACMMNERSGTHVFILKGDYTVLVQDVNTRKPVIVQVTEGGGTAVLSLVHLEFINDEEIFHNEGFAISDVNKLNQSKSARIWMLSHVLQILGISCKPGNLPELTPMYLMARNMVS